MQELIHQVLSAAQSAWRFRWIGLITAWLVAIAGTIVSLQIPDRYEAAARVYVDTQSILRPLMQGLAIQPNVNQQVEMLSRTLISRPNIEKLIRMADLDLKTQSGAEREALIERLIKEIGIRSTGRDNLYTLSYADSDREKAKRLIQALVSIFVESSLGSSRKDTDAAKTFLDEQIKNYEAKLEQAETRMKEFRIKNIDRQLAEGKDSASQIGDLQQQLEKAKLDLKEAENARDAAKQQLDDAKKGGGQASAISLLDANPDTSPNLATPEIDSRLDALRRNLDALLQRYTEAHPEVIIVRRQIKELEQQKRKEQDQLRKAAAAAAASAPAAQTANPLVAALTPMLASAESQVAALRARVGTYTTRLATARASLRNAPEIEAEAAQLNRDYGIIKKNYDDLVSRRQAASMSSELEMASGVADFRLIDPPRVSPNPVFPNRLLLLAIVIGVTLASGVAAAFAASILRPSFNNIAELRTRTGLPILGGVSFVLSESDRRIERLGRMRFYLGSGSLLALLGMGMVTYAILGARHVGT